MGRQYTFRSSRGLLAILGITLSLSGVLFSSAHGQSGDQLEIFRTLTPEQQRAVLEAMESGQRSGYTRSDKPLEFPETVRPRQPLKEQDDRRRDFDIIGGQLVRREIRIRPEDTILLHLELVEFEDQRLSRGQVPVTPPVGPLSPGQVPEQGVRALPVPGQAGPLVPEGRERIVRTTDENTRLSEFRSRVLRRNPYRLDKWGILNVPELGPIPLAGLTVAEATQRLTAESALNEFIVRITLLPLDAVGVDALKPFGYDLFAGTPSTFAPATDVPVPAEYVVGPGDTVEVQLIGNTRGRYSLVVGRDGRIDFPELGPIPVSGRRFQDVREDLEARVRDQMIGTQASVTIGELRSIRIFVLGDAQLPGSYTVSGLSTITNALFVSGGIKEIGSLRNIQLKREGRIVTTLDLYDLLLNGDTSSDLRLLPNDVIFIPPVGATVSVSGEVRRPAIYELKQETSVEDLLALAGGLTAKADPRMSTLERISGDHQRVTLDIDLSTRVGRQTTLQSGDVLRVAAIRPVLEQSVTLHGHVYRPGQFQFRPGMRLLDLIGTLQELKPNADHGYVLVRRELPPDRRVSVFSADLGLALSNPSSAANLELAPRDEVFVFDLESGRDLVIEPLLREIRLQSGLNEPAREISVSGQVKVPGTYPLEPGMRLSDAIRAGGGVNEAGYGGVAEVTRYTINSESARQAELIEVDLTAALHGDPAADIPLRPHDRLVVKEIPLWAVQDTVEIRGEVRFPGRYPIRRGETLSSLMRRAGGLTSLAFAEGAIFTRRELQDREAKQLESLAERMHSDLAQLSLQAAQEGGSEAGQALAIGQSLLANLRETRPVGRLVIDLERSMQAKTGSQHDVILRDGDSLIVPRITQEVTVIGEVQSATSHLYDKSKSLDDYIAMSGGLTARADRDRIYVVRANGSIEARSGASWFHRGGLVIRPGDTIVAPLDTERMRPLPFWQAVTQIIYNLTIPLAAIDAI